MKSYLILFKTAGYQNYIWILAALFSFASCSKDDFDPDRIDTSGWEPEMAFPLVYSEIGINELVKVNDSSTTIEVDQDQFCTLIYDGNAFTLDASQIVTIPDQQAQRNFNLTAGEISDLNSIGQVITTTSQDVIFATANGIEADTLLLKNGNLVFQVSSGFPLDAALQVTIPGLTLNGFVYQENIPLAYNGTLPITAYRLLPLAGYRMDLTRNGTTHNTLRINYRVIYTGSGAGITPSNQVQCNATISNLGFGLFYGYAGQQQIAGLEDSLAISIFNNAPGSGNFTIADPEITFDVRNSMGIPFSARMTQLTALQSNLTDFTVASGIPDPLPVLSPGLSEIGTTKNSSFTLDKNNSNIVSMFEMQPAFLVSRVQASLNPGGRNVNFLTDSSRLSVDIHAALPFNGTAKDFVVKDTVPFSYNDLENVSELLLRINVENGFPIESSFQLIFMDDLMNPLDSIFLPGEAVVPSGTVDFATSRVATPGRKQIDRFLTYPEIQKILTASKIVVMSSATTYNNGNTNVKIFADYRLKVKVGAIAKLKIQ